MTGRIRRRTTIGFNSRVDAAPPYTPRASLISVVPLPPGENRGPRGTGRDHVNPGGHQVIWVGRCTDLVHFWRRASQRRRHKDS